MKIPWQSAWPSAGGVSAFVNGVDLVFELVVTDRADDDVLTEDESWRTVDLEGVGELHDLAQARLDLGALHVLGELVQVEAELAGDGERLYLADGPVSRKQLRVEDPELVARQLIARGAGHLRRLDRTRSQNRIILENQLEVRIVLHELCDVRQRAFAEVAIVVEEFDERRAALRVPEGRLIFRAEQSARLRGDDFLPLRVRRFLVMLVERFDRLAQHFRVVDEIILDERAQFLLLRRRKLIGAHGRGHAGDPDKGGRKTKCSNQLHQTLQIGSGLMADRQMAPIRATIATFLWLSGTDPSGFPGSCLPGRWCRTGSPRRRTGARPCRSAHGAACR